MLFRSENMSNRPVLSEKTENTEWRRSSRNPKNDAGTQAEATYKNAIYVPPAPWSPRKSAGQAQERYRTNLNLQLEESKTDQVGRASLGSEGNRRYKGSEGSRRESAGSEPEESAPARESVVSEEGRRKSVESEGRISSGGSESEENRRQSTGSNGNGEENRRESSGSQESQEDRRSFDFDKVRRSFDSSGRQSTGSEPGASAGEAPIQEVYKNPEEPLAPPLPELTEEYVRLE